MLRWLLFLNLLSIVKLLWLWMLLNRLWLWLLNKLSFIFFFKSLLLEFLKSFLSPLLNFIFPCSSFIILSFHRSLFIKICLTTLVLQNCNLLFLCINKILLCKINFSSFRRVRSHFLLYPQIRIISNPWIASTVWTTSIVTEILCLWFSSIIWQYRIVCNSILNSHLCFIPNLVHIICLRAQLMTLYGLVEGLRSTSLLQPILPDLFHFSVILLLLLLLCKLLMFLLWYHILLRIINSFIWEAAKPSSTLFFWVILWRMRLVVITSFCLHFYSIN